MQSVSVERVGSRGRSKGACGEAGVLLRKEVLGVKEATIVGESGCDFGYHRVLLCVEND
jgi:hypothetical protein